MPQYLRIDKDVKAELLKLSKMIKQYSNFDVLALDREVTRTMEIELDRQSADYKKHRHDVEKKLKVAREKLEQCILAKDEIIQLRHEEMSDTINTFQSCQRFQD